MRSPHVVVGFHHWGLVGAKFAYSLARAVAYEGRRIQSVVEVGSPYTDDARNKVVEAFLATEPPAQYLLMVDADIEFEKDAISKTMWVAQNFDTDVVWGNYALGGFSNSLARKDEKSDFAVFLTDLKPNMIYEGIYGGGTGWCLMDRRILVEMKEAYPRPWHWFDRDIIKNEEGKEIKLGEDLSFGRRVWNMGGTQVGYTGVVLIHHKTQAQVPKFMGEVMRELKTGMIEVG